LYRQTFKSQDGERKHLNSPDSMFFFTCGQEIM